MKHLIIILLTLVCFFNGFSQQEFSKKQIIDSIETIRKDKNISGLFISVVSKDSILFKSGFGYADVNSKTKTTSEHLFKIGSVSKTFTALAIMKLIEEGKLSLEDKLADIAPEIPFENKWEATHPVKVKHLLEHKAGFDDMHISVIAVDRTKDMTALDEVMKSKGSLKSRWQPGLGHAYSNPGYTILGFIIEKITNQPYQDYIKNEIIAPLQMNKTVFRSAISDELPSKEYAVGYMSVNDTITESRESKIIGESAGALLSNADDMSRFLQFMLNDKLQDSLNVVSSSSITEMETLHSDLEIENNITTGYALGLYTRTYGTNNLPFIGHSGGINGFASDFIYSKELDLGIAISNNGEKSNAEIIDFLVDTFTNTSKKEPRKSNIDLTEFSEWNGEYRILTTRNQIFDFIQFPLETVTVEVTKDSLYLTRFLQDQDTYLHQEGIAFSEVDNPNPSLFLVKKDGKRYLNYNKDILVPVNSFGFLLLRILIGFSLIIGIVGIIVLLTQSIIALFKKSMRPKLKRNLIMAIPMLLLVVSVVLFFSNATLDKLDTLGQFNILTILIFLFTTLFPIASIWAAYWLFKNKKNITNRFLKMYYHLVVFGALFLSIYCIYHNWFMKMMWN